MATGRHDLTRAVNSTLTAEHGTPSIEIEKQADSASLDPKLFNAVECYHRFLQDPVRIHELSLTAYSGSSLTIPVTGYVNAGSYLQSFHRIYQMQSRYSFKLLLWFTRLGNQLILCIHIKHQR
jgi:hypothetical protein